MTRICVNVLSVINSASNITTETIDGKEHIVVKDVCPVVDNIVLNSGLYPADEINKGYKSLEGKPMPFGHPKIDGNYVSASNVRAVNEYHVGAFARNVHKEGERVLMDMCVNRRYAEANEHGKELVTRLDAMKAGETVEPIGISTGLGLNRITANGQSKGKKYTWIATNQDYDHCAILLHETPAGTPAEGVGIFVNAQGEEMEIETVKLSDAADLTRETLIDKVKFYFTNASTLAFDEIRQAISTTLRQGRADDYNIWVDSVWPDRFVYEDGSRYYQQKYIIDDDGTAVFVGDAVEVVRKPEKFEIKTNGESNPMKDMIVNALKAAGKPTEGKTEAELFDAFNQMKAEEVKAKPKPEDEDIDPATGKPKKKPATTTNSEEVPTWFAPFAADLAAIKTGLTANADTEKANMRIAVKAKFGMTDIAVNALDGEPLKELYSQTQKSAPLNGGFQFNSADKPICDMPE